MVIYTYKNISVQHSEERTAWLAFVDALEADALEVIGDIITERLRATDWTQTTTTLSPGQKQLYDQYRQELLNISRKWATPSEVFLPTEPTEAQLLQAKFQQNRPAMANRSLIKDLPK